MPPHEDGIDRPYIADGTENLTWRALGYILRPCCRKGTHRKFMQILHSLEQFEGAGCVAALGTFDGVHRGHAHLIGRAVELAAARGLPSAAVTFDRHPLALIRPESAPMPLTTNTEKEALMAALGLDVLIEQPFTRDFAAQTGEEFLAQLCGALHPAAIVIGYNHTYGRFGRGDAALLRTLAPRLHYEPVVLEPFVMDGAPVSSTRIRALLAAGDTKEAERLAGHALLLPERRTL